MTTTTEAMIARRASKGYNPTESAELLAELFRDFSGEALAYALHYNAFATARAADAFAATR